MLVLMCGTSFSGRSTFARALAAEIHGLIISLDEINERRGLWGGDGIPVEEWQRTHQIATAKVRTHLLGAGAGSGAGARWVVVDDTSSLRVLRDGWRGLAAELGVGFALIYLDVDHATIRRRLAENRVGWGRRDVADVVLEEHLAGFERPAEDEGAVRVGSVDDLVQVLKYLVI
ncbi:ATP-binding protein [Kribbella sp. NPDC006257]|uniref:AAA family ATPase n=1 Tax=Kribbella sp. NPDC006257 TaxID=3156738 RepID=UPI0033A7821D